LRYFALQKQCLDLEEAVQVYHREGRRSDQEQLLEKMGRAVQEGDKELYDSLIQGKTQSLLPTQDEAGYNKWLEIQWLAAKKRWSRDAAPSPSNPVLSEALPPPPAAPPLPSSFAPPPTATAAQPLPQQATIPPPPAPSKIPEPIPAAKEQAAPKRPSISLWVWGLPTAVIVVVVLVLFLRHSSPRTQVVINPAPAPSKSSSAPPPASSTGPVTLNELLQLFDHANKAAAPEIRTRAYREFMQKGADFAMAHPAETNLWVKRAKSAMELDYPDAGWVAGKKLTALNLTHSQNPEMRGVMADLASKGWLGPTRPQRSGRPWTKEQAIVAASDGDEEAQVALGNFYFSGLWGFNQDAAQAAQWYRKAAEQGNSAGQEHLGAMYEFGRGVRQDFAEALRWFRKAAEEGDPVAQNNLAFLSLHGLGGETNNTEALKLVSPGP
jgi:hypothetical protein